MDRAALARYVAEFVGTFMLVFSVGCNVISKNTVWAGVSIGATLMVLIYALGGVSGAHLNPAVSVSLAIAKKVDWQEAMIYSACQVFGGICAGVTYSLVLNETINLSWPGGMRYGGLAETLYTLMLCFVVLNVACSRMHAGKNEYYGLAIGFVVVAGAYAAGHVSAACFNPAVAFGVDVSSAHLGFGGCLAYSAYELVGAALAAGLYRLCRPDDYDDNLAAALDRGDDYPLSSRLLSEFIGTFMLVVTVGCNVMGKSPAAALSIAASLMSMIYALGSVSGAHFNPAVTIAIYCANKDRPDRSSRDAGAYMGVQILGGLAAALTYSVINRAETFRLAPAPGYSEPQAWILETVFTFLLAFVVLSVACVERPLKEFFGLAIAFCVTAGGYAIGGISGGSLNPAVSAGVALSNVIEDHSQRSMLHGPGYMAFEALGGVLAASLFMVTRPFDGAEKKPLCAA
eukprot:TRINITY_DN3371_c0_g1_i1.p1 TRINITY_DN3371_c0_g1~~TRINITY_DN3371_c0_g1_i1.p1  ORF type:complete len:458 (+),score=90.22 TRINITY_DN3371_c0_g1_i1:52-1425(+)